jgi:hypothetical protein
MIAAGIIDADRLLTGKESHGSVLDAVGEVVDDLEDSFHEFRVLFGEQPFLKGPDMTKWLRGMLGRKEFSTIFVNQ